MPAAFARSAPERRMSAAFTAAIHVALLAALLTFRPDLDEPVDPARPLAVDLVPAPPPEVPVVEPVTLEEARSRPSRQRAGRPDPGAAAPRALRPDMDRTLSDLPAPAFPPGPAQAAGQAPDGEAGTGSAGAGAGAGAGGSGSGPGAGSRAALDAPHWIAKPTWSQMKLHNPPRAAAERVSGTAVVACRIELAPAGPQLPDPERSAPRLRLRKRRSGRRAPRPNPPRPARRPPRLRCLGRDPDHLPQLQRLGTRLRRLERLTGAIRNCAAVQNRL